MLKQFNELPSLEEMKAVIGEEKIKSQFQSLYQDFDDTVLIGKNPVGGIVLFLESLHKILSRLKRLPKSNLTSTMIADVEQLLSIGKPTYCERLRTYAEELSSFKKKMYESRIEIRAHQMKILFLQEEVSRYKQLLKDNNIFETSVD